jgi:HTH-type transcriptional regulator / antitoxin HipB
MTHIVSSLQVGRILASRRKALGISQAVIAAKLGITQGRVSELETQPGALTVERLLVLLNILGLELEIAESKYQVRDAKVEW